MAALVEEGQGSEEAGGREKGLKRAVGDRLAELKDRVADFVAERDWAQFHSPRNLAACLCVEASELLELYMWTRDGDAPHPPGAGPPADEDVAGEVADVLICLLNFAFVCGIDPVEAAFAKLERLKAKYPVELARGSAVKSPGGLKG